MSTGKVDWRSAEERVRHASRTWDLALDKCENRSLARHCAEAHVDAACLIRTLPAQWRTTLEERCKQLGEAHQEKDDTNASGARVAQRALELAHAEGVNLTIEALGALCDATLTMLSRQRGRRARTQCVEYALRAEATAQGWHRTGHNESDAKAVESIANRARAAIDALAQDAEKMPRPMWNADWATRLPWGQRDVAWGRTLAQAEIDACRILLMLTRKSQVEEVEREAALRLAKFASAYDLESVGDLPAERRRGRFDHIERLVQAGRLKGGAHKHIEARLLAPAHAAQLRGREGGGAWSRWGEITIGGRRHSTLAAEHEGETPVPFAKLETQQRWAQEAIVETVRHALTRVSSPWCIVYSYPGERLELPKITGMSARMRFDEPAHTTRADLAEPAPAIVAQRKPEAITLVIDNDQGGRIELETDLVIFSDPQMHRYAQSTALTRTSTIRHAELSKRINRLAQRQSDRAWPRQRQYYTSEAREIIERGEGITVPAYEPGEDWDRLPDKRRAHVLKPGDKEPAPPPTGPSRYGVHAQVPVLVGTGEEWTGPEVETPPGTLCEGERALVPQMRASFAGRTQWIPIRGTGHNDLSFFEFEEWHWHVDLRFIASDVYAWLEANSSQGPDKIVLRAGNIRPLRGPGSRPAKDGRRRYYVTTPGGEPYEYSTGLMLAVQDPTTWQRVSELVCLRREPLVEAETASSGWTDMQNAFEGRTWGPARRCPHQGLSLEGVGPDAQGLVRCPLHGLIFEARTGCVVDVERVKEAVEAQKLERT